MKKRKWKFSSGPWSAKALDSDNYFPSVSLSPNLLFADNSGEVDHRITIYEGQPRGSKVWGNTREACRANALVISAVPEMVEALETVIEYYKNSAHIIPWMKQVQAALDKAEGLK